MKTKATHLFFPLLILLFLVSGGAFAGEKPVLVRTLEEYHQALKSLQPGDTLMLANGIWKDAELVFKGKGTQEAPIVLIAETPGKVFLEGRSNLRIGGEYLVVKGLVFQNGWTPSSEVISFSIDSKTLAYNSRVTECVIDNFNNPDRNAQDSWVMMFGKNNRFDHNHIEGKRNVGVTMAVRLNSEESQDNRHQIDHNYFGPRPVLGSNGGETLRVGTSTYSLTNSNTVIENNFFDKCNGETEIISIKSGGNIIRGNVFFESKGSLTLRHGNGNVVERNVFLGNGKSETGGVRVINADQKIVGNYFQELRGEEFRAGIAVMNGVPNSSINRYHQVKNAQISHNTLVNVAKIELAVGSDAERTAVPVESSFADNLLYSADGVDLFKVYDQIDGISFQGNLANFKASAGGKGVVTQKIKMEKGSNGLLYPSDLSIQAGAPRDLKVLAISETGPTWYPKSSKEVVFGTGKSIPVAPGLNTLSEALNSAKAGDVILLDEGVFEQTKVLDITFPISFRSEKKVEISFVGTHLFELYDGGSLSLEGIEVTGEKSADAAGNAVIKINRSGTLHNYKLKVLNSRFSEMNVNHSFNFLEASPASFADTVEIRNSEFRQFTGSVLSLRKEIEDLGKYNAEYVILTGNQFEDVGGMVADVYRGGTDESTFGPYFIAENNAVKNSGKSSRNKESASFSLVGVQWLVFSKNNLAASAPVKVTELVGKPFTCFSENNYQDTPALIHAKKQNQK
ncbi:polysaccharide lyase 6 family protein [Algoriphagus sp. H41]|uniref:Polysaccharide lyase 6 family protein n=1 Tax=Algoriphagus oliviformis TaxID=2811231 RepID=A0ABS3BYK6_9BACT|nr:polysaccharide lyase 6 family protein [Algoriphagus oliviformis]MBN7809762.1 polysaccharide lyase 6 family protein [Algoriphagus oliviformis]